MQSENLETFLRNRNVEGYDFENQYPEIWLESTLCDWKKNYSVLWILNGLRDSLIKLRNYFSNVNFVKMLDSRYLNNYPKCRTFQPFHKLVRFPLTPSKPKLGDYLIHGKLLNYLEIVIFSQFVQKMVQNSI